MLNIMFGQSKYYVDSLSENTKRGLREKLRRGEFPGLAPIGYLNDYRTKKIVVDPERAPIVKHAFEMYATGTMTLDRIRAFFGENGIVTRNGYALLRAHVSSILSNPFYYGHFRYNGEVHEGTHAPIISKGLFDKVDAILNRRWRFSPSKHIATNTKPFRGLLHCATCGGAITAELQRGHVYYRCTKKGRMTTWCRQPYIREELLEDQISTLLKPFTLPPGWADQLFAKLEEDKKQIALTNRRLVAQRKAKIIEINGRLQKLVETFLDDLVDRETYAAEKAKLLGEKKSIEEQRDCLNTGRTSWLEPFEKWIFSAKNAEKVVVSGTKDEKRGLALEVFGSNMTLDYKKASGTSIKPWSFIPEKLQDGGVVPGTGLEPARLSPYAPQTYVSASSTTRALLVERG